jgi:hypothetical protein
MSVVRPEYGPTLPELLGPRVGALPKAARIALAAMCALVLVAAAAFVVRREELQREPIVVRAGFPFNMLVAAPLERVPARPGERLRLQTGPAIEAPQSVVVRPLRLRPYRGDVTAALMGLTPNMIQRMRSTTPGFVWRGDGRVNFNRQPGYEILFQARIGGRTTYGRRILLTPSAAETPPRDGADITILAARSDTVPSVASVGNNGALKTAIRSFRFGTERP